MYAAYYEWFAGCFECSIFFITTVIAIVCLFWFGHEKQPLSRHPILVGRYVEFTLDGDKLVRGKVTSQQGDRLGITWMNRRGEMRFSNRTIAKVSLVE